MTGTGPAPAPKRPRREDDPFTRVSKDMSRLLRHQAPPGTLDAQGFMALPTLMRLLRGKPSEDLVRQVCGSDTGCARLCAGLDHLCVGLSAGLSAGVSAGCSAGLCAGLSVGLSAVA